MVNNHFVDRRIFLFVAVHTTSIISNVRCLPAILLIPVFSYFAKIATLQHALADEQRPSWAIEDVTNTCRSMLRIAHKQVQYLAWNMQKSLGIRPHPGAVAVSSVTSAAHFGHPPYVRGWTSAF